MKRFFVLLLIIAASLNGYSNTNLKAYFTYCTFNSPETGPYIETYLSVNGNSAVYKPNEANKLQSTIEVTLVFKNGEEIKSFKKFNLLSPELEDSLEKKVDFMDQQRISLPQGEYNFEISIKDINSLNQPFVSNQKITLNYPKDKISISDIELIESLQKTKEKSIISKSGYDVIPYTSDFYSEDFFKIAYYAEIYNADKALGADEGFLINSYIESNETSKLSGNYKSISREKAKPVNAILSSFDINKLPSGNYNLVVEVRNKTNEMVTQKKVFFQRSNPSASPILMSEDYINSFVNEFSKKELTEHIKSIEPISTTVEINFAKNQLKGEDEDLMRQFFYNFWITRNESEPEKDWKEYLERVKTVNKLFSTGIKRGYTTDRGRVYLKYNKPNTRTVFPSEPNAYPYEIWHYYKIEQFSNKKFVFYSPDVVTNDYPLLHSDMPGHINYPQWKMQLQNRTNQAEDMENENPNGSYGSRSDDYFNNPR